MQSKSTGLTAACFSWCFSQQRADVAEMQDSEEGAGLQQDTPWALEEERLTRWDDVLYLSAPSRDVGNAHCCVWMLGSTEVTHFKYFYLRSCPFWAHGGNLKYLWKRCLPEIAQSHTVWMMCWRLRILCCIHIVLFLKRAGLLWNPGTMFNLVYLI